MMIQGALRVLIELLVCGYSSSDFVFRRSLVFCSGEDTFVALRRTGRGTPLLIRCVAPVYTYLSLIFSPLSLMKRGLSWLERM